jgi:hypothetical protein
MREVLIKNKEILERLDGFIDTINSMDMGYIQRRVKQRGDKHKHYATSKEYLKYILGKTKKKEFRGPPEIARLFDLCNNYDIAKDWQDLMKDVSFTFAQELGAQQNALFCYYPEDGYIGWHDNRDAPGYTVLFNWSKGGDAFYRYRDWKTGKIHTIKDRPGWTCKTGWYGPGEESTFHCAMTNEPRWSIAFYMRNETMRDQLVEEIESE